MTEPAWTTWTGSGGEADLPTRRAGAPAAGACPTDTVPELAAPGGAAPMRHARCSTAPEACSRCWFAAVWSLMSQKDGASALRLKRVPQARVLRDRLDNAQQPSRNSLGALTVTPRPCLTIPAKTG